MSNMSEILSQYDANLRAIVAEYKAFGQTHMVRVLSPAVRERVQAEVANFVQAKKQQLDAASKLLAGLADFAAPASPTDPLAVTDAFSSVPTQPSALLDLDPLPMPIEPVLEPPSPTGVVRIATEDEWDSSQSSAEVLEELPPVEETPDEPKAKTGHDGHENRPKPRRSRGSAVPVKEESTIQRSTDAPDNAPSPDSQQGRRIRKNQRKREGMAAIAPVSEGDIHSNAVGGLTGDSESVSDPHDFVKTAGSRSTNPEADSNNDFDRVVERTREMQAEARVAKSKQPDAMLLIPEALIIDSTGVTVGRASRIYKSGKQIEIDEIELYLGDDGLAGDWSSEVALADGESVWRSILKRREIFEFRGSDKKFTASLGNGRLLGFDENDENVLVVEEVALTKAPEPVGGPVRG